MNATLTITIRVLGAQAAKQVQQVQQQVQQVQNQANRGGGGGGWLSTFANAANTARTAIAGVGDSLLAAGRTLGGWANNMSRVGRQMTFGFTLPFAFGIKTIADWALENQRAMTMVEKVYGDGSESAAELRAETDALAESFKLLSGRYGENQADVIRIGAAWAAAGLKQEALAKATETTLQAMTLGEMDADKTIKSIMAIAAAYQLSFKDMGNGMSEVSDALAILNAVENQTGATFADLVDGVERSASAARAAGIDIEYLAAMIAALTPTTGSGAAAGNSIKTIISRIMAPTKQTQEILKQIGIDISGKEWNNSTALQKLQQLTAKFNSLDQSTKNWVSTTVAGRWQLNRFEQLMKDLQTGTGMYSKALEASESVQKRQQTYWRELTKVLESNPKKFEILSNVMKNELADLGVQALPILLALMNALRKILEWFNNLSPGVKSFVFGFLTITAIGGPVLLLLSALAHVFAGIFTAAGWAFKGLGLFARGAMLAGQAAWWLIAQLGGLLFAAARVVFGLGVAAVQAVYGFAVAIVTRAIPAVMGFVASVLAGVGPAMVTFIYWIAMATSHLAFMLSPALGRIVVEFWIMAVQAAKSAYTMAYSIVTQAIPAFFQLAKIIITQVASALWTLLYYFALVTTQAAYALSPALGRLVVQFWILAVNAIRSAVATTIAWVAGAAPAIIGAIGAIGSAIAAAAAAIGIPTAALVAIIVGAVVLIAAVVAAVMNEGFRDSIIDAVKAVGRAIWAIPQAFANMLSALIRVLRRGIEIVIDLLSYLNPFARHSPSLVDNVKAGVSVILSEYSKLRGIPALVGRAAAAHEAFLKAVAPAQQGMDAAKTAEQRTTLSKHLPAAVPAFDNMVTARTGLENSLPALTQQIDAQKRTVVQLQSVYDNLDNKLKFHQAILDDLQKRYDKVGDAISDAKNRLQELLDTPITGMTAMTEEIYQNELAQKRLKLAIMDLENAGQSVDDLQSKFAALGGEMEKLQGERQSLYLAGAGSDILATYDDQIGALKTQRKELQGQSSVLSDLQKQLDKLERVGERLSLTKALTFDDQVHQLERMSKTVSEMPFDQIAKEILKQKDLIAVLEPQYESIGNQIAREKDNIEAITVARDRIGAQLDLEKEKLDQLEQSYADIKDLISSMVSDVESLVSGLDAAAKKAADAAGIPAGDYDIPGGTGPLFDEAGTLAGIEAFNDDLQKQLEDALKGMPDPFEKLRDMWDSTVSWLMDRVWNIADFFTHVWWIMQDWGSNIAGWFGNVVQWFKDLPGNIWSAIQGIPGLIGQFVSWAGEMIGGFLSGLISALPGVMMWFLALPGKILSWIPNAISWLWYTGLDIISGVSNGLFYGVAAVFQFFINLPGWIWNIVFGAVGWLLETGKKIIGGMWNGLNAALPLIWNFLTSLPSKIIGWLGDAASWLVQKGADIIKGLWNGVNFMAGWLKGNFTNIPGWIWDAMRGAGEWLVQTGKNLAIGLWNGINSMARWLKDRIIEWAKAVIPDPLERFFGISSPSKLMAQYGNYIVEGLANGILDSKDMTVRAAQTVAESVQDALTISPTMSTTLDINSTIGSLPNFDVKSMTQDLTMGMAQAAVSVSNTALTQAVQQTMAMPTWDDRSAYPPDTTQSDPLVVTVEGGGGDTIQISVDNLVLPNITSSDDAKTLLDNLKALADD